MKKRIAICGAAPSHLIIALAGYNILSLPAHRAEPPEPTGVVIRDFGQEPTIEKPRKDWEKPRRSLRHKRRKR